jgi:anti-sigma factor RsiW
MDGLLAPWVDGEISPAEGAYVEAHLARCPPCRARAAAERRIRSLLQSRRPALAADAMPASLSARLAAARPRPRARRVSLPAAAAAVVALLAGGWGLHELTLRSTSVLAAQLAADHVKCHLLARTGEANDPARVEKVLADRYGFDVRVPPGTSDGRLRLVGARRCLTGEGTNAHVLYRFDDQPVSLYLVPEQPRAPAALEVAGQQAVMWPGHNGTYVLLASARPGLDVTGLARNMQRVAE